MSNAKEIRQITKDEYIQIAELKWTMQCEESPTIAIKNNKDEFIQKCLLMLLKPLNLENYFHFGVFENGTLIAIASLCIINKIPRPQKIIDKIGYLTNVYVLQQLRNKGIGNDLIIKINEFAHDNDSELIIVWPSDKSKPFYNRLDYKPENQPLVHKIRDY